MTINSMHANDIKIGDRQRQTFSEQDLQDLAVSILTVGLIHAPVVCRGQIVAGERRLRALAITEGQSFRYGDTEYEYPEIPVHEITRDDPEILFRIELEENLRRVNLSPMEEANAIAKLHKLRLEQSPEHNKKKTAEEVAGLEGKEPTAADESRVAKAILVNSFADDPEVQKAARVSLNKAATVAAKKMEMQFRDAISSIEGPTPRGSSSSHVVLHGDALEILPTLPDESFDILLFDPPYGINADKFGEQAMDLGHQYSDDPKSAAKFTSGVIAASARVLPRGSHVLMFCAYEMFEYWKTIYQGYEFTVWPRPLIWSKGQQSHAPVPQMGPRYSYECILFAMMGRRPIANLVNDVFHVPAVRDKDHAAEKPAELLSQLLHMVADPGDRVLDPCCGSGSIFEGAAGKELHVTGIEQNKDYFLLSQEKANAS